MASISVVKMASKFDLSDSFIVVPQDAWADENGFSKGDLVDIDGQTFKISTFYDAQTDKDGNAIISDEVQMNQNGRGRFEPVGATPPDSFSASMSQSGTTDIHLRQASSSSWQELSDEAACRVTSSFKSRFELEDYDRIEITLEDGSSEVFGIYRTQSEETSADDVIRMGQAARDRLGLNIRSADVASINVRRDNWDVKLETADASWEEVGTDPFSCRLSDWFIDNNLEVNGTETALEQDEVIEIDGEGETGYFGINDFHQIDYVRPVIRTTQAGRDRITAFAGDSITVTKEVTETPLPVYVYEAESIWGGVNDQFTVRPSGLFLANTDRSFENNFTTILLGDFNNDPENDFLVYGWQEDHRLDNTLETIRMGQNARDRMGVSSTDPLKEANYDTYEGDDYPVFLDFADASWPEVADEKGLRVPDGRLFSTEIFYDVELYDGSSPTVKYGCKNSHFDWYGVPLVRMGQNARDRLQEIPDPQGERINIEATGEEPDPVIDFALSEWDNVGDEFAVRPSAFLAQRYDLDRREDNFIVRSLETGEENFYGTWETHEEEIWWPTVRMGQNARERIGSASANSKCRVIRSDKDVVPRADFAQSEYFDEIGNALLLAASDFFLDNTDQEVGDFIKLKHMENGRERVFRINRETSLFFDRMDSTMRMGYWGRNRFFKTGEGETVQDEFPLEWEPYDETDDEFMLVGVNQSLTEWSLGDASERIALPPAVINEMNLDMKYDSPPESDLERGEGNANASWDNVRLSHADYPEDRYAAYTAFTEFSPNEYPKIRMPFLAREKLANPDADPEVSEVPNSFVVRLQRDVPNPEMTSPDGQYNRIFHHRDAYHESDLAEYYREDDSHRVCITAPHGGFMESGTTAETRATAAYLESSYWICEGRRRGGGSFDRWHITSSDIDQGFPKFKDMRKDYDYALSWQGWTRNYLLVGGTAPQDFRETLGKDYLQPLFENDDGTLEYEVIVYGLDSDQNDENFAGDSPLNFLNRMTKNGDGGIQIEQPFDVRTNRWRDVAQATARFFINELDTLYE